MNARFENSVLDVPFEGPRDPLSPIRPVEMLRPTGGVQTPPVTPGRRPLIIAGVLVLLAIAGVAVSVLRGSPAPSTVPVSGPVQDRASLTVALASPVFMSWQETMQVAGGIYAWQEASVGAEVSGLRLVEVNVDVGDQVRKGQLLARFDEATMLAAVNQQKAVLAQVEASAAEADANASRAAGLRKSGALSEQNIVQYETRAHVARAEVESARARLHSQELALSYTRVLAPDDGVISSRNAMLGSVAGPGTELFRLVRQNRIEWRAEVPAAQLARIQIGQIVSVELQDGTTVQGTVRQIAPMLNESTRVGIAYVELDHANSGSARPGMYANGTIALGERPALTVPASAIVLRDGHEYVFTVDANQQVVQNKVTIGRRSGGDVEIVSGLGTGMGVVTSGAPFLNDGDLVRVSETGAAMAAPAVAPATDKEVTLPAGESSAPLLTSGPTAQ
jgi:RND family efflux transporter MFP subunit